MNGPNEGGNVTTPDPEKLRQMGMSEQVAGQIIAREPLPVRFSYLKALGRSPAHCKLAMDTDRFKLAEEPNVALERGTALHHLVFGTQRVIGYTEGKVRRGKEWEAFQEENKGALVLTAGEYETVARMGEAVMKHEWTQQVLKRSGVIFEQSIRWLRSGRICRATPDANGQRFLADLKSCEDSRPEAFQWSTRRYSYHAQMAWYQDGTNFHRADNGISDLILNCFIIAVESKAPFPVTVLKLTDRALELGRKQYSLWFERFQACEQSNEWPAYAQSVVDLDVPEDETELIFEEE